MSRSRLLSACWRSRLTSAWRLGLVTAWLSTVSVAMAAQVAPDASLSALLGRHCQASPGAAVAAALPAVLRAHWRDPQARAQAELDPAAAQRLACAGVAGAPTEADRAGWAIELASALVGRGEGAAAQAVLTAVRAETGAWADGGTTWLEGPWQFTQATIHYAASRHAAMRGAMDLALAAFEGGPLADTAWHAAALIGRADGWQRPAPQAQAGQVIAQVVADQGQGEIGGGGGGHGGHGGQLG